MGNLCKIGVAGIEMDVFIQDLRGKIRKCDKCNKPSISYVRLLGRNALVEFD